MKTIILGEMAISYEIIFNNSKVPQNSIKVCTLYLSSSQQQAEYTYGNQFPEEGRFPCMVKMCKRWLALLKSGQIMTISVTILEQWIVFQHRIQGLLGGQLALWVLTVTVLIGLPVLRKKNFWMTPFKKIIFIYKCNSFFEGITCN